VQANGTRTSGQRSASSCPHGSHAAGGKKLFLWCWILVLGFLARTRSPYVGVELSSRKTRRRCRTLVGRCRRRCEPCALERGTLCPCILPVYFGVTTSSIIWHGVSRTPDYILWFRTRHNLPAMSRAYKEGIRIHTTKRSTTHSTRKVKLVVDLPNGIRLHTHTSLMEGYSTGSQALDDLCMQR